MNTFLPGDPSALLHLGKAFPAAGSVTISGLTVLGQQLVANLEGTWEPAPTAVSYQWLANGVAIRNATSSSYTLTSTDVGKVISVFISASAAVYTPEIVISDPTSLVLASLPFDSTSAPTIEGLTVSGDAIMGRTLTATVSAWEPTPTTLTYQWLSNGATIRGATASSYVLKSADVGKRISVRVVGSRVGYSTTTLISVATSPVLSGIPFDSTSAPTIEGLTVSGDAIMGRTLTATVSAWEPTPTTLTYQWLSNGATIRGATASSYVLKSADVGKRISVRVVGSRVGYSTTTLISVATSPVLSGIPFDSTSAPTISGSAIQDQLLTAVVSGWSPTPTRLTYQWLANGVAIRRATAATYLVKSADFGKAISVRVTASAVGYATVTLTSSPTSLVTR